MSIDNQYQRWGTEHLKRPPIPKGYVLPVQHAIQGHPESPCLWEKHITNILQEIDSGVQPTNDVSIKPKPTINRYCSSDRLMILQLLANTHR